MNRDGLVIGLSGGIDSAVAAELCVRALGKEKVLVAILPERESNPISKTYALRLAEKHALRTVSFDITPALEGLSVYSKRDEAIRRVMPEYTAGEKAKITLPGQLLSRDALNFFTVQVKGKNQTVHSKRLDNTSMREIVAATNVKQRMRMVCLYYYAEVNNYIVCGTTNRSEYIQGFFVKYGDGGVDIEPIAHLYKVQVYQLARYLGVNQEIIDRAPSPDTFSFPVTDEEMYFRMPYDLLDPLLYAWEHKVDIKDVCFSMGLDIKQVERAFRDFRSKYNATEYQRMPFATLNPDTGC